MAGQWLRLEVNPLMNSTNALPFGDRKVSQLIGCLVSSCLLWLATEVSANPVASTFPRLEWTREQRTAEYEYAFDVSADALGNIFITGETEGPLSGTSLGLTDAFLSRYDAAGVLKWTINIGSNSYDVGN